MGGLTRLPKYTTLTKSDQFSLQAQPQVSHNRASDVWFPFTLIIAQSHITNSRSSWVLPRRDPEPNSPWAFVSEVHAHSSLGSSCWAIGSHCISEWPVTWLVPQVPMPFVMQRISARSLLLLGTPAISPHPGCNLQFALQQHGTTWTRCSLPHEICLYFDLFKLVCMCFFYTFPHN